MNDRVVDFNSPVTVGARILRVIDGPDARATAKTGLYGLRYVFIAAFLLILRFGILRLWTLAP